MRAADWDSGGKRGKGEGDRNPEKRRRHSTVLENRECWSERPESEPRQNWPGDLIETLQWSTSRQNKVGAPAPTLGRRGTSADNPDGVAARIVCADEIPGATSALRLEIRVGGPVTQGSREASALGSGPESRWDSPHHVRGFRLPFTPGNSENSGPRENPCRARRR